VHSNIGIIGMGYRGSVAAVLADADVGDPAGDAPRLAAANINPATGLATDYLNHCNEAIMLLEMQPSAPEFRKDFLRWRPVSYREHFAGSGIELRDAAIAALKPLVTLAGALINGEARQGRARAAQAAVDELMRS